MKWDFEITAEENLKLEFIDFSNGQTPELVLVNILGVVEHKWMKIGDVRLEVNGKSVIIHDFVIGSRDGEEILGFLPNSMFRFRQFRNKGVGSKTIQRVLSVLHSMGIAQVSGNISTVDDVTKVANFWRKNGFKVNFYDKPRGLFVAEILKMLKSKRAV